jgi:hypothetical protein
VLALGLVKREQCFEKKRRRKEVRAQRLEGIEINAGLIE